MFQNSIVNILRNHWPLTHLNVAYWNYCDSLYFYLDYLYWRPILTMRTMRRIIILFGFLSLLFSCSSKSERKFVEVPSTQTTISFSNTLIDSPELNILNYLYYYNGAGVVTADFNNDSLVDIYFVGNQIPNQLYLNKGKFQFVNVTAESNLMSSDGWNTGATQVDINNDGLLDIYVCQAAGYRNLKGQNKLYINQGINANGTPTFKESAKDYGLDFEGLSTQSAFFDFDLDGDLDMYLLNHSVHPNRNYGRGVLRKQVDSLSGDRIYENVNGYFNDVSSQAGIYQGKSGYGLDLSISDLNNDGYPDIYVGNDFFENDYLYINQKNGTFREIISENDEKLGNTTHFSMGNDIADINNDGQMDIVSLDMLPENLETYKTSGLEYPYPIYRQYLNQGFAPQYMQNTLHLNLGDANFAQIGNLSGIAATEWSWGALIADFDNDGYNDAYISNGIKGATNDMDYMNFIANENIQRRIDYGMTSSDMPLVNELPIKKAPNYFFRNNGDLTFSDISEAWLDGNPSFSNGCTYSDLDNDGDLDIIVNNINEPAYILENTSNENYSLTVMLEGKQNNPFGVGSKLIAYQDSKLQVREHFTTKGYLSAKDNRVYFGLGKDSILDSLKVIWPNRTYQTLTSVKANTILKLSQKNAIDVEQDDNSTHYTQFQRIDSVLNFVHKEAVSLDFDRQPLIPFAASNEGPGIAIADINDDGLDDIFINGAKRQASSLYIQREGGDFSLSQQDLFNEDAINEDVESLFFDSDNDGDLDLLVVSGGNEFLNGKPLQPRFYKNESGVLFRKDGMFSGISLNASKVVALDYDNDNDNDIIITADQQPSKYGVTPKQFIFQNNGKDGFLDVTNRVAPDFEYIGNVKDIVVADVDQDGLTDFMVVGHWMPISIFLNKGSTFELQNGQSLSKTHGWWNSIAVNDYDNDGDLDIFCGNWGLNTKFKANNEYPITLYLADFDQNGSVEPLVTYFHDQTETPFASKDELVKQMPFLNKKFLSYKSFAKASVPELFGQKELDNAQQKKVYLLESSYFENTGDGKFAKHNFPRIAQSSTVRDMLFDDVNSDGYKDLLIIGNDYEISTQLGRLDALRGVILQNDKNGGFFWQKNPSLHIEGASRNIHKIKINDQERYVIGRNNKAPLFIAKKNQDK